MLSKLAFRNAKRSIKDYIIYLITVILSFSFIFAFILISNSNDVLNLCEVMENFKYVMYFVNIFIALTICFLINYTTKFMFLKRSREFGTYMLLGITRKKITKMFTLENIILGFISLLASIFIGYLFSLFFSSIIMNIFALQNLVKIDIKLEAILLLFLYFVIIYLIVLLLARRRIKKMKIYNLLYFSKQNEKKLSTKSKRNVLFVLSLILGIAALYLFDKEFSKLDIEPSIFMIFTCIILIIISIYLFSITFIDFSLKLFLNKKSLKYRKDNLFIIRTFSSKIRTMSFTLGTLAVLVTFTLISLNISSLFKGVFDNQIELNAPYDISIATTKNYISDYEKLIKQHYKINKKIIYNVYSDDNSKVWKTIIEKEKLDNFDSEKDSIIKLSDYNKLLKLRGMSEVRLKSDEYIIHMSKEYYKILNDSKDLEEITFSNGKRLFKKNFITDKYTYAWGGYYRGFIIVVPDDIVENMNILSNNLIVDTKEETTEEFAKEISNLKPIDYCKENDEGINICYSLSDIKVRGYERANNNGYTTIISFVCFYISFIFTAVVGTILAIQSLSDSTKYKYRYQVLKKLGVNKNSLYKTIFKQLSLFFIFPLVYPIIISSCSLYSLNKIFKIVLINDKIYIEYYLINLSIFTAIYIIYFLATYFGFKKNINND